MANYIRPQFDPVDLSAITDHDQLHDALDDAAAQFRTFIRTNLRPAQLTWANNVYAANNATDIEKMQAAAVLRNRNPPFTPYERENDAHDVILASAPLLYTYMSHARLQEHLQKRGLRVSYGAERLSQHQQGEFPRGAYATSIPPFTDSVGTMDRHFFDIEYSLPAADDSRPALDIGYWVAFPNTTGFSAKGSLVHHRFQSIGQDFSHYALPTRNHNVGAYIDFDIIAFGKTLIPLEAEDWGFSDDETAPISCPLPPRPAASPSRPPGPAAIEVSQALDDGQPVVNIPPEQIC
jgi:hypothetical protein